MKFSIFSLLLPFIISLSIIYCQNPVEVSVFGAARHNSGRGYVALANYPKPVFSKALDEAITKNAANSYIVDISSGGDHSIAVDNLGNAWVFGSNYEGLGLGCSPSRQFGPIYTPQKLNVTTIQGNQMFVKKAMSVSSTGMLVGQNVNEYAIFGSFVDVDQTYTETVKTKKFCFPEAINFAPIISANEIISNITFSSTGILAFTTSGNIWAMGNNLKGALGLEESKFYKVFTKLNFTTILDINPDIGIETITAMSTPNDATTIFLTSCGRLIVSGSDPVFSQFKVITSGAIPGFDNDFTKFFATSVTPSADTLIIETYLRTDPTKIYRFLYGSTGTGYQASGVSLIQPLPTLNRELGQDRDLLQEISLSSLTTPRKIFTGKGFVFVYDKGVILGSIKNTEGKIGANTFTTVAPQDFYMAVRVPQNLGQWFGVGVPETNKDINNNLVKITIGDSHSLFLSDSGRVYAAGDNSKAQLGIGNEPVIETYNTPTTIQEFVQTNTSYFLQHVGKNNYLRAPFKFAETEAGGEAIAQIAAASDAFMVLTTKGRLFSWGKNDVGQLFLGHREFVAYPSEVDLSLFNMDSGDKIIRIAPGSKISAVLTANGAVYYVGGLTTKSPSTGIDYILYPRKMSALWLRNLVEQCSATGVPAKIVDLVSSSGVEWHYFLFEDGIVSSIYIPEYDPAASTASCKKTPYTASSIVKISGSQFGSFALLDNKGILKVKNPENTELVELIPNVKDFSSYQRNYMVIGTDNTVQLTLFDWSPLIGKQEMASQVLMGNGIKFVISTRGRLYAMGKNNYGQLGIGWTSVEETSVFRSVLPNKHICTRMVSAGGEATLATVTMKNDDYWNYFSKLDAPETNLNLLAIITPFVVTATCCCFFCCFICCIMIFICCFCGSILLCFVFMNVVLANIGFLGICLSCFANCCSCCTFCVGKSGVNAMGTVVKRTKRKSRLRKWQKKLNKSETKKLAFSDPFIDNDANQDDEEIENNNNDDVEQLKENKTGDGLLENIPNPHHNNLNLSDDDEEEQIAVNNKASSGNTTARGLVATKSPMKSPLMYDQGEKKTQILKFAPLPTTEEIFGDFTAAAAQPAPKSEQPALAPQATNVNQSSSSNLLGKEHDDSDDDDIEHIPLPEEGPTPGGPSAPENNNNPLSPTNNRPSSSSSTQSAGPIITSPTNVDASNNALNRPSSANSTSYVNETSTNNLNADNENIENGRRSAMNLMANMNENEASANNLNKLNENSGSSISLNNADKPQAQDARIEEYDD